MPLHLLTDEEYDRFRALLLKDEHGISGVGISIVNGRDGLVIGPPDPAPPTGGFGGSGGIVPCRVQRNGGTDGDAMHDCTATYDLYALDNTTKINTTDGPYVPKNAVMIRSPKTPMTYGTYGHYYWDSDGTTRILVVYDEHPTSWNSCS
jgi:hypothetical protein